MTVQWVGVIYDSNSNPAKIRRFLTKEDAVSTLANSYRAHGLDVRISDVKDMAEIFVDDLLAVHIMLTPSDDAFLLNDDNNPMDFA